MTGDDDATGPSRRAVLGGLAGLATAGGVAGCTADAVPGASDTDDGGDTFRYAQVLPPVSLDPVTAEDPWSNQVVRRVFQSLYVYDRDLNLVPVLADGAPDVSADGTRYTVSLRDDPVFHDGSTLSAADVKYSFEAPRREDTPNRWKVDLISEVRTPDDATVEFTLANPYPNFDHSLTQPVVPRSAREANPEKFGREYVVGTGPYRVRLFKRGKYAVLERWSDYWGPARANLQKLEFVGVHSGLARTTSLRTGQNDLAERIQPKFWEATGEFPNAHVVTSPSYTSYYLGFNTSGTPFEHRRVREAVDYLVSMDEFVETVVGNDGRRQYGPVPPQVAERWGFPTDEWRAIPHGRNDERARTILADEVGGSGWSPTVVAPHSDYLARKLATKVAHGLKNAGFRRARAKTHHWREFRETVTSGNQDDYAMFVAPQSGGPDPDSFLYPMVHENMQGLTNGVYYNEESVMRNIRAARETDVREERKRRYEDAIGTLLEDRAIIPAFTLDNSFGVKRHVEGFEPHPMAEYNPMTLTPAGDPSLDWNA